MSGYDHWKTTDPADRYLDDRGEGECERSSHASSACTCRRIGRVDRWCPVHGLDPDAERERIRDEDWR